MSTPSGGPTATEGRTISLAILDDHPILLRALAEWIGRSGAPIRVVATASSWVGLLADPAFPSDVVLLDIDLGDDLDLAMKIRTLTAAGSAVVIISTHAQAATIQRALEAGARGYVVKSEPTAVIIEAIRTVASGAVFLTGPTRGLLGGSPGDTLTARERLVVGLFAEGLPLKQLAAELRITQDAARSCLRSARAKYREAGVEVGGRIALRRQALRDGIIVRR
ncbi:response regulator transcription factor [Rathayibacter sp. ZW T2_19]|uniref:Response regulator transcription factor n=1 Tax=Rathayibacter rubneri TaxID=2950106 RepID=A0A9X2DZ60_9MICO|nr:response regulator transcription factor [Rathayibacter rubneri]MCM6763672.1 response regulator transcription factor [Rathayibacter rubneri]